MDYFSDITAQQLYNNNLYQQTFSTRSIGGGISGAWSGLSVSGNYQRNESFYNTNDSFVSGQAPGVIASFTGRRIARLPLYASANFDASRVLYQQKSGLSVADFGLGKVDLLPVAARAAQHPAVPVAERLDRLPGDLLHREPRPGQRPTDRGAGDAPLRRHARRGGRPGVHPGLHARTTASPNA